MKKNLFVYASGIVLATISIVFISKPGAVLAVNESGISRVQERKEIRQEMKEEKQEAKDELKTIKTELKESLKISITPKKAGLVDKVLSKLEAASILNGTVTGKTDKTLTVSKDDKSITVNITDKTKLRRRYWGKATLEEIKVNDKVNVHGRWANGERTAIDATLIRDLSVRKRAGVFFGEVSTVSGNTITMKTLNKGTETVTVTTSTRLVNRREQKISATDITAGHRIRVKGLWDSDAHTITEVTQVKDFDLPVVPTVKPKTSVTPSVSITPTVTVTTTPTPSQAVSPTPTTSAAPLD